MALKKQGEKAVTLLNAPCNLPKNRSEQIGKERLKVRASFRKLYSDKVCQSRTSMAC